jgi:hypothetical protein
MLLEQLGLLPGLGDLRYGKSFLVGGVRKICGGAFGLFVGRSCFVLVNGLIALLDRIQCLR